MNTSNVLPVTDFLNFVSKERLFDKTKRILLAVSGGKDSVFMAHLFAQAEVRFAIAHCNFQLRGKESDEDERFVKALAKTFQVDFFSTHFDTLAYASQHKISIQMAARELRFSWFESIRKTYQYDKIAIAQHQTDVVETMLLNLVRGTGISGLHGILPKRNHIIRPLLFLTAEDIREAVTSAGMAYREDQSNASTKYKRNAIRHQVLPILQNLNTALESTFIANAKRFYASERLAEAYIEMMRDKLFIKQGNTIEVSLKKLETFWEAPYLFELFKCFNFTEPVLTDLMVSAPKESGKSFYSDTHCIMVDRNKLFISPNNGQEVSNIEIFSVPARFTFFHKDYQIYYSDLTGIEPVSSRVQADADKVKLPITIRSWNMGDRFQPLGMRGKKKVSDFLIQKKVPLVFKNKIPLLTDADHHIVSIGTLQLDERYKITANTEKVLIFEQL